MPPRAIDLGVPATPDPPAPARPVASVPADLALPGVVEPVPSPPFVDGDPTSRAARLAGGGALVLAGVILAGLNLRTAVTSVGPVLTEVRGALGLSGAGAGVLTMLPTVSFAAFGALTPRFSRRIGSRALFALAMTMLAAGQALRAVTDSIPVFFVTTVLALSGIAVANVLLPVFVREAFPQRMGLVTGLYTMSLTLGSSVSVAITVPVAQAFGSWRFGLGGWAVPAAVAALPWLIVAWRQRGWRPARTIGATTPPAGSVHIGRTRLGWLMMAYFGMQSLSAYAFMGWLPQLFRDAGFPASTAGLLVAMVTAVAVPFALLMPTLANRRPDQRPLVLGFGVATLITYAGLAVAPRPAALLWIGLLAIGQCAFPFVLTLIGLRARTAAGTVALSAFAQSGGYVIGALGPFVVGVLYDLTGGWSAPLGFLAGVALAQTLVGLAIGRPRFVEDERARPRG